MSTQDQSPPLRPSAYPDGFDVTCDDVTTDREPYQCQGCGAVRYGAYYRDRPHNCWRNEDGTYEEGGTFQ